MHIINQPILNLTLPPSHNAYAYSLTISPVDNVLVQWTNANLGQLINSAVNGKLTPMRLASIVVSVIVLIQAVGLIIAGTITSITPLCFAAIPLIGGSAGLLCYGLWEGVESPRERQRVREQFAEASLEHIAKAYESRDVIGYQLLDGIVPRERVQENKRVVFYARYQKLSDAYKQLKTWQQSVQNSVYAVWSNYTKALRDWHNSEVKNMNMLISRVDSYAAHEAYRLRQCLTVINYDFDQKIAPWNHWKMIEMEAINNVFNETRRIIEQNFAHYKAEAVA